MDITEIRIRATKLKMDDRPLYEYLLRVGAAGFDPELLNEIANLPLVEDHLDPAPLAMKLKEPQGHTITFPGNPPGVQIWEVGEPIHRGDLHQFSDSSIQVAGPAPVDEPAETMPKEGWAGGVNVDDTLAASTTRIHQRAAIDWSKCPAWATSYRAKYNHRTGHTQAEWFNEHEAQHAPTFFHLLASDRGRVLEFKFLE